MAASSQAGASVSVPVADAPRRGRRPDRRGVLHDGETLVPAFQEQRPPAATTAGGGDRHPEDLGCERRAPLGYGESHYLIHINEHPGVVADRVRPDLVGYVVGEVGGQTADDR